MAGAGTGRAETVEEIVVSTVSTAWSTGCVGDGAGVAAVGAGSDCPASALTGRFPELRVTDGPAGPVRWSLGRRRDAVLDVTARLTTRSAARLSRASGTETRAKCGRGDATACLRGSLTTPVTIAPATSTT